MIALVLAALCAGTAPQDASSDAFARALVEPPRLLSGDRDGTVRDWIELARGAPDDPLAEAALLLIDAVRADIDDPPAYRAEVLGLDPALPWTPAARRVLERLRLRAASQSVSALDAPPPDEPCFLLSSWDVLGPLPPANDPRGVLAQPELFDDPGFSLSHDGVERELHWRGHDRSPWVAFADPLSEIDRAGGWALLAARFDVDGGGPAWLEFDFGTSAGNDADATRAAPFAYGGCTFPDATEWSPSDAAFAFAFDRGSPQLVDRLAEPSGVVRRPVLLRDGRNELLLRVADDCALPIAVRVLDADGAPVAVRGAHDDRPLGRPVDARPPSVAPGGSIDALRALDARDPDEDALLGLLLALDGRPHEGRALLERAARSLRPGLLLLAAGVIEATSGLPAPVRKARARELLERARSLDDAWLASGVAQAGVLAGDDRETDAVELLTRLGDLHPVQISSLLELAARLDSLGLPELADGALDEASRRAPASPRLLDALAARRESLGRPTSALELREAALRADGPTAQALEAFAGRAADAGRRDLADRAWDAALVRNDDRRRVLRHARFLAESGRETRALDDCAALAARYPEWAAPVELAVDAAQRTGDVEAERALLGEAVRRRPASPAVRERMASLSMPEPAADFFARWATDADALLASLDAEPRDDSLVDVLDEALVCVFPDGTLETLVSDLRRPRDLDACAKLGKLTLRGDVLDVRSRKADGSEFVPVPVAGRYVLPNLEPGDLVQTRTRLRLPPSAPLRLGRWTFASTDGARVLSRYVVRVPKSVPLRFVEHDFDGVHETIDEGDALVHVFEARDLPRVLRERGAPPDAFVLPWVEFGQDEDEGALVARTREVVRRLTAVTPELEQAAREAAADASGQTDAARALLRLVHATLDERTGLPVPALVSFVARRGHPALLFAALLDAVGIARDLVWTRDLSPDADPEPGPAFRSAAFVERRLLVRVRPDDGEPVLCDPDGLPFGMLRGDATGAPTLELRDGTRGVLPEADPPGTSVSLTLHVARDGSATVDGNLRWTGGQGFLVEDPLATWREGYRRAWIGQALTALVGGFDLTGYALAADPDDELPAELRFQGRARHLLDADGTCGMPLAPLRLSAGITSGARRTLPFRSEVTLSRRERVVLDLGGRELLGTPEPIALSCGGWTYSLELREGKGGAPVLVREFVQRPFALGAADYAGLADFCARVDQAERGLLRFGEAR